jgi:peptidoglycan hydrolase FlgJ
MEIAALSAHATATPAWLRQLDTPLGLPAARGQPAESSPDDIRRAAGQFEAIIVRQMLAPSLEPLMAGGLGGGGASAGGGVYGYMLTDTFARAITAGGGFGLADTFAAQLLPPDADQPPTAISLPLAE